MQASLQNQHELSICNINDWCDCYPMLFADRSAVLYIANYSVTKVESSTRPGAGRWHGCPREDRYASLVGRAANDSDGVLI